MEFLDVGSLLDVLRLGDHRIPISVLKAVAKQVLEAMEYLHTVKRVIHRDVKPGNILLNRKGEVKLADFGVCSRPRDPRDSHCATWVGTVTYMSPERITGDVYSFNADVWAVHAQLDLSPLHTTLLFLHRVCMSSLRRNSPAVSDRALNRGVCADWGCHCRSSTGTVPVPSRGNGQGQNGILGSSRGCAEYSRVGDASEGCRREFLLVCGVRATK